MEKWQEIYSVEDIEKIQELELKNLKELIRVTEKLGIEFFLYGGSLIGAVRHNGFVPWDDDLDVAMMRNDYNKFVKEANKYLSEEFYLQTPYSDKKSPYFYSKLRLKGTRCIEYAHHKLKIESGVYIDIYPIDSLPESNEEYMLRYKEFQKAVRTFVIRQCPYPEVPVNTTKKKIRALAKRCISLIYKLVPHKKYAAKIDEILTSYNGAETTKYGNYSYPKPVNYFNAVCPFEKRSFCGIEVNIPADWDGHLKRRYGNYMELPPEEKRVGHIPYNLDFGNY